MQCSSCACAFYSSYDLNGSHERLLPLSSSAARPGRVYAAVSGKVGSITEPLTNTLAHWDPRLCVVVDGAAVQAAGRLCTQHYPRRTHMQRVQCLTTKQLFLCSTALVRLASAARRFFFNSEGSLSMTIKVDKEIHKQI